MHTHVGSPMRGSMPKYPPVDCLSTSFVKPSVLGGVSRRHPVDKNSPRLTSQGRSLTVVSGGVSRRHGKVDKTHLGRQVVVR